MIPGGVNLILAGGGEYEIANSLRFRRSNNAVLTRTAGTPTNAKIATWSFWHKRGALGGVWVWGESSAGASTFFTFDSSAPDTIRIYMRGVNLTSTPVFRDPSAWYHIVVAVDTTQAVAANRIAVYVNNQAVTMSGTITLNADLTFNESGKSIKISNGAGWFADSRDYIDGYLAEFNFIDGQQLTPSSFGQTDSTTGVWIAKKYTGSYGNNGFYLKFADASAATAAAIGKDSSGNGNNWTPSGISVTAGTTFDQMTDTPTLNYCVLNPIDTGTSNMAASEANMKFLKSGVNFGPIRGTFGVSSGKWYFEMVAGGGGIKQAGVSNDYDIKQLSGDNTPANTGGIGAVWDNRGYLYRTGGSDSYAFTYTTNDVVMVAYDFSSGKVWFGKNGTWNTGDPAAGTSPAFTVSGPTVLLPFLNGESGGTGVVNFGQRAFAYTPPSGFKALNTANLPTPSIKKGSIYFDATLRTGTGATASVSSLGFQPDLVWIKSRSAATDHALYDSARGVQKQLESNQDAAETTETTGLTAFSGNGYTVGALAQLNTSSATYVDWAWKEGATPGFDIVTYTGNATNRTIAHTLGAVPHLIIVKSRDSTIRWTVQHRTYASARYGYLNGTFAFDTANANLRWNSTDPTSSVFSIGTSSDVNANSTNYVAYLWSEVEGFSKISSYTGNGSTDGPFVFCGFRPRWIMIKASSEVGSWTIMDTSRIGYNASNYTLYADLTNVEQGYLPADILSNGFKLRLTSTGTSFNTSSATYIFVAYAENPFKYARAR